MWRAARFPGRAAAVRLCHRYAATPRAKLCPAAAYTVQRTGCHESRGDGDYKVLQQEGALVADCVKTVLPRKPEPGGPRATVLAKVADGFHEDINSPVSPFGKLWKL